MEYYKIYITICDRTGVNTRVDDEIFTRIKLPNKMYGSTNEIYGFKDKDDKWLCHKDGVGILSVFQRESTFINNDDYKFKLNKEFDYKTMEPQIEHNEQYTFDKDKKKILMINLLSYYKIENEKLKEAKTIEKAEMEKDKLMLNQTIEKLREANTIEKAEMDNSKIILTKTIHELFNLNYY